jgi:hypothetical protein
MINEAIEYPARILKLTGRTNEQASVQCRMCSGVGCNGWESPCSNCAGDGHTTEWVFDCGHKSDSDDCEDCFEACQVQVDLDVICGRLATQTYSEPWTPAGFTIKCCDSCAESFEKQGYRRVTVFPLEHPQLKSLSEVQSERGAA